MAFLRCRLFSCLRSTIDIATKVRLATKKELVVIATLIWSLQTKASKGPEAHLTTKGGKTSSIEESWEDELFHLLYIMNLETPTVGLPRDDIG